jgi:hypothetical protein
MFQKKNEDDAKLQDEISTPSTSESAVVDQY